jgi:hypothetical protein
MHPAFAAYERAVLSYSAAPEELKVEAGNAMGLAYFVAANTPATTPAELLDKARILWTPDGSGCPHDEHVLSFLADLERLAEREA